MTLAGHTLKLWFAHLDTLPVRLDWLSDDEQSRVARKGTDSLRHRQAASFTWLRERLASALGTEPASLVLVRDEGGKPRLVDNTTRFNLSHSGAMVALAICPSAEVGVDIEQWMKRPTDHLAEEILSAAEMETWHTLHDGERQTWLTMVWARKEAVLKAAGQGLRIAPRTFSIHGAGLLAEDIVTCGGELWAVCNIETDVPEGYCAAVAVRPSCNP